MNQKGASLLVVLMAGAAIIGAGYVFLDSISLQRKSIASNETRAEANAIYAEILGLLKNPGACEQSFIGLNASSSNVTTGIKNSSGTILHDKNTKYGTVELIDIKLTSDSNEEPFVAGGTSTTKLEVSFDRGPRAFAPRIVRPLIKLQVTTNPDSTITGCVAVQENQVSMWEQRSDDNSHIFFLDEVSIGAAILNEAALSVTTPLKFPNTPLTCDAPNQRGILRYNGSEMQFCAATGWRSFGRLQPRIFARQMNPTAKLDDVSFTYSLPANAKGIGIVQLHHGKADYVGGSAQNRCDLRLRIKNSLGQEIYNMHVFNENGAYAKSCIVYGILNKGDVLETDSQTGLGTNRYAGKYVVRVYYNEEIP